MDENWKNQDNKEFRLNIINQFPKGIANLSSHEANIYSQSRTQNEYLQRMSELNQRYKMIIQQQHQQQQQKQQQQQQQAPVIQNLVQIKTQQEAPPQLSLQSQFEDFIKQRLSTKHQPPPLQPIAMTQNETEYENRNKRERNEADVDATWKKSDNTDYRLSRLNQILGDLSIYENSIYNASKSENDYAKKISELHRSFQIIFEELKVKQNDA